MICKKNYTLDRLRMFGDFIYKCGWCMGKEKAKESNKKENDIHEQYKLAAQIWWIKERQKHPQMQPQNLGRLVDDKEYFDWWHGNRGIPTQPYTLQYEKEDEYSQ